MPFMAGGCSGLGEAAEPAEAGIGIVMAPCFAFFFFAVRAELDFAGARFFATDFFFEAGLAGIGIDMPGMFI